VDVIGERPLKSHPRSRDDTGNFSTALLETGRLGIGQCRELQVMSYFDGRVAHERTYPDYPLWESFLSDAYVCLVLDPTKRCGREITMFFCHSIMSMDKLLAFLFLPWPTPNTNTKKHNHPP
jgi:hypothetical protein